MLMDIFNNLYMEITTEFIALWPTPAAFKSDITAAQLFTMSAADTADATSASAST